MSNFNAEQLLSPALQGQKPNNTCALAMNSQEKHRLVTTLYHNPITATVREIIFNAIDATKLLPTSQRQPIEIHLPSKQELFFAVTDHATGMSPQEVKNIYLHYGISTKTHNPQQIGSYGIGAQAPLSYTQTFVMTTVKDQQETTCLINLQQVQLYTKKTTAANGTMVKIPLSNERDIKKFYRAIKNYVTIPIPGIKFTGLDYCWKGLHPYGDVIKCGTIQVAQQTLQVYWHCIPDHISGNRYKSLSEISNYKFYSCFGVDYAMFNNYLHYWTNQPSYTKLDLFATTVSVKAVLGGFEYSLGFSENNDSEFIIELQPGIVNFSAGRDKIVADDKQEQLCQDFCQQISASFVDTIKAVGLRKMVNTEMFPWAVRACADYYLIHPELVPADPLLIKQLFTNQQHVNLWELAPRPLALLDLQDEPFLEIESYIQELQNQELQNQQQLFNVVKTRFEEPQQRPSLFHLIWNLCRGPESGDILKDLEKGYENICQEGVINVFTSLHDWKTVRKIIHHKKKIIKSTLKSPQENYFSNFLLLFQEPQAQVQPVVDKLFADIPITIHYYSNSQTAQLVDQFKPVRKNILTPFRSQIVDNAFDFYQLCCDVNHTENDVHSPLDFTLGLIVDNKTKSHVIANFGEEILKNIFLFQAQIVLQVNLYRASDLRSYNMKQIQQQNDLILCLHHFTKDNLQYYVSKFNLPSRQLTLSDQTQDVLLLLLYWSQMLETQVDLEDYEDLRLPLEKLLKLSLVQQDAPLNYPFTNILDDFQLLYPVFKNNFQTGKLPVQSVYTEQEMRWIKQVTNKP